MLCRCSELLLHSSVVFVLVSTLTQSCRGAKTAQFPFSSKSVRTPRSTNARMMALGTWTSLYRPTLTAARQVRANDSGSENPPSQPVLPEPSLDARIHFLAIKVVIRQGSMDLPAGEVRMLEGLGKCLRLPRRNELIDFDSSLGDTCRQQFEMPLACRAASRIRRATSSAARRASSGSREVRIRIAAASKSPAVLGRAAGFGFPYDCPCANRNRIPKRSLSLDCISQDSPPRAYRIGGRRSLDGWMRLADR